MLPKDLPLDLYEIPALDGLAQVSKRFDVELTAIGGFVRRIALYLRESTDLSSDLAALVPFSSDIDLVHTGKASDTPAITAALIDAVPFGEAFRWQVRSTEEALSFTQSLPFNGIIPALLMTLSTRAGAGFRDPWDGVRDVVKASYRYIRNGFYQNSPLYRSGRDLELFSALLYFKALLEDHKALREIKAQPGLAAAREVIADACNTPLTLRALQESSYLRTRLVYLIKDLKGLVFEKSRRIPLIQELALDSLTQYLLDERMFGLGKQIFEILGGDSPLLISAHLGGDQFRLPDSTETILFADGDTGQLFHELNQKATLAEGQELLFQTSPIEIAEGFSHSEGLHEFVHLAIPLKGEEAQRFKDVPPDDLSVLINLNDGENPHSRSCVFPAMNVCSFGENGEGGMLWIRVNAFNLLRDAGIVTRSLSPKIQLILLRKVPVMTAPAPPVAAKTSLPAIIFVHGIFSNSEGCFQELMNAIKADPRSYGYATYPFNYDFHSSVEDSGKALATFINKMAPSQPVILICHSMGGLVGRMAVLSGNAKNIKRLIMLGTPNFGVLRTSQAGLFSQLALHLTGKIYALFRKPGLSDLTRVTKIFQEPIRKGRTHAEPVEYVTIPGEFFNESRAFWEIKGTNDSQIWLAAFGAIGITSELLNAIPLWRTGLAKPHDGIVESVSNALSPSGPGRLSEKSSSINDPGRFGCTYFHIEHEICGDLTHVTLQHNPTIIDLIKDLTFSGSVNHWHQGLTNDQSRGLKVTGSGM